jgi:hypothetical protein
MRRFSLLSLLLSFLTISALTAAPDTLRVLFVGNSYVQVNSLPDIVAQIAANRGDVLIKADASVGGYTLQNHLSNTNTRSLIAQKGWDFVVLQEQSQLPAFPDAQVAQDCYPYARALDSLVHLANPCAKTVFYMTWGRKNGDAGNCPFFPLICTYNGMDSLLRARYSIMAQTNKAILAPVGAAWHKMRDLYPATNLYQTDESHPSEAGSYLAACTFYTIFFKKNPVAITYDYTLGVADAANIRQVVKAQVWDSLSTWYQYRTVPPRPVAGFTQTLSGRTAQFSNSSAQASRYLWTFGDGSSDTATAPQHTYAANGAYTVRLIAMNCDGVRDTLARQITIGAAGVAPSLAAFLQIYPNPAQDRLNIASAEIPALVTLYDAQGRMCLQIARPQSREIVLELKGLPAGLYFLHVRQADGPLAVRMISVQP